jgi:hypothetical protein
MENKIKSFEDACAALGLDPSKLPIVDALPEKHQKAIVANYKLIIVAEALNEGWEPNWNNYSEWKYFPWFEVDASEEVPSGVGFSDSSYGGSASDAALGSRLCYRSSELALYAGEQFNELYKEAFLILK